MKQNNTNKTQLDALKQNALVSIKNLDIDKMRSEQQKVMTRDDISAFLNELREIANNLEFTQLEKKNYYCIRCSAKIAIWCKRNCLRLVITKTATDAFKRATDALNIDLKTREAVYKDYTRNDEFAITRAECLAIMKAISDSKATASDSKASENK